jgi:hypothetical protein
MMNRIDHPEHYNYNPKGIECIDVVEHFNFNIGNAIKYLWRAEHKGNYIEDLEKAVWYITRELGNAVAEREKAQLAGGLPSQADVAHGLPPKSYHDKVRNLEKNSF